MPLLSAPSSAYAYDARGLLPEVLRALHVVSQNPLLEVALPCVQQIVFALLRLHALPKVATHQHALLCRQPHRRRRRPRLHQPVDHVLLVELQRRRAVLHRAASTAGTASALPAAERRRVFAPAVAPAVAARRVIARRRRGPPAVKGTAREREEVCVPIGGVRVVPRRVVCLAEPAVATPTDWGTRVGVGRSCAAEHGRWRRPMLELPMLLLKLLRWRRRRRLQLLQLLLLLLAAAAPVAHPRREPRR